MQIIDRYIFRQIGIAAIFIVAILSVLVLLTQSLRYLELVMNAGASGMTFWVVTLLSLPSFLEVILPIGMVAAILFVFHRMIVDSELPVLRALGFSPLRIARPALFLAVISGLVLFVVMGWIAPVTKSSSIVMRKDIKAQMSSLIFREGVFTEAGTGLMVYIRGRDDEGNLLGLVIHDQRDKTKLPSTIIAARGVLVSTDTGHQVLVYDGSRQQFNPVTGILQRLDFDRYTIDLPEETKAATVRWREPEERTLSELLSGDVMSGADRKERRAFHLEIRKRFLTPLFVLSMAIIGLVALLLGHYDRRGQGKRILFAVIAVVVLEIFYMTAYNIAKNSVAGYALMMLGVLVPIMGGLFLLAKDKIFFLAMSSVPQRTALPADGGDV